MVSPLFVVDQRGGCTMRDFSWKYFSMTGDVDAYLLYKEVLNNDEEEPDEEEEPALESAQWLQ
jgi:hypothetical protein